MDKIDKLLIDTLKKHGECGKGELLRRSFCRESQRVFTRRVKRMAEVGMLDISIKVVGGKDQYTINLGEKYGK